MQSDGDKLLHEVFNHDQVDLVEFFAYIKSQPCLGRADDETCLLCGLVSFVKINAFRYAFGPELCIAERVQRDHLGARERIFRLQRETIFKRQRIEQLEERIAANEYRLALYEGRPVA